MPVAKVTELIASSRKGFPDAIAAGVKRATKTIKNVSSAWVADQEILLKNGRIDEYRVRLKITFVLEK